MAIGFPSKNSRPEGRTTFGEAPNVIKREVMRPGSYSDGTHRDGTPAVNVHKTFVPGKSPGYLDASSKAHRAAEGSAPPSLPNNEHVRSKAVKNYGKNGSRLEGATYRSTGEQPAGLYRDPIAPSLPQVSRPRASDHHEHIGWIGGVNHAATHPNTGKHFGGHASGAHTNTDAASGQAHSASGGEFGKPQVRPAPTARAGVDRRTLGPLERDSYTSPKRK